MPGTHLPLDLFPLETSFHFELALLLPPAKSIQMYAFNACPNSCIRSVQHNKQSYLGATISYMEEESHWFPEQPYLVTSRSSLYTSLQNYICTFNTTIKTCRNISIQNDNAKNSSKTPCYGHSNAFNSTILHATESV